MTDTLVLKDQQLIGVDVGGTKIAVASLSDAVLQSPRIMPTAAAGGLALIDEIVQVLPLAK